MDCGVDPLKWDLKWINGICYRLHPEVDLRSRERIIQQYPEEDGIVLLDIYIFNIRH